MFTTALYEHKFSPFGEKCLRIELLSCMVSTLFNFLRNALLFFRYGHTILHSHQPCLSHPVSRHHLIKCIWWFMVFVYISQMANVEHLFMYLIAIFIFSVNCLSMFFCSLSVWIITVLYCWVLSLTPIIQELVLCPMCSWHALSPGL